MLLDFIKVPYTTAPNMVRNTGPIFEPVDDLTHIASKSKEIDKYGLDLYASMDADVVIKAARHLGFQANSILELAFNFVEDIAILHKGLLSAICFCYPSGFIPSKRVGLTLEQVHKPVADGDALRKASARIAQAMSEQDSFRRYVWTVTVNPDLSNHPKNKKNVIPTKIEDLYFRMETQTTARVDQDTSLFFVKVDVKPLIEVWQDNKEQILGSINSMTDSIIDYKNLAQIKQLLNTVA